MDLRRVTKSGNMASMPSWSPDGKQIAFAMTKQPGNLTDIQIYVVNTDGKGMRQLTNIPGQNLCPKWFPDGSELIFYHTPVSGSQSTERLMRVSTDGRRTAVFDVGELGGYFPDIRRQSRTKR